jgi:hypothetical protein
VKRTSLTYVSSRSGIAGLSVGHTIIPLFGDQTHARRVIETHNANVKYGGQTSEREYCLLNVPDAYGTVALVW